MATLSADELAGVAAEAQVQFSAILEEIPVNKAQFKTFLNTVDSALEQAEIDVVQNTPAGPGKDWLLANQNVGRELLILVAKKRLEVL